MNTVELSEQRIGEEIRAIQEAARKLETGRRKAINFLRRIGADGWPHSPTKRNGVNRARLKRA